MYSFKLTSCLCLLLLLANCAPSRSAALSEGPTQDADTNADNDDVSIVRLVWNWFMDNARAVVRQVDETDITGNDTDAQHPLENHDTAIAATSSTANEGRTFGKIRRLQMAMIPIVFKFGVISAMVTFLVLLGIKSVFLLKLLLLINTVAIIGKFLTFKSDLLPHAHQPMASWSPYIQHGWGPTAPVAPQSKEIHLHLHGLQAQGSSADNSYAYSPPSSSQIWSRRNGEPYSAQVYSNYNNNNVNGPLEEQNEVIINGDGGLSSADGIKAEYLPKNHRNF